jgi:hypothetical protein
MRTRFVASGAIALALAAHVSASADKAAEVIAAARKAIGDTKLDALKTLSIEASVQRNMNNMQMTSDVEILLDLPDKYVRSDQSSGPMSMGFSVGFVGARPIRPGNASPVAGGGMMIRIGPGGPMPGAEKKLTPEEQEQVDRQLLRSARTDISRLMLGWFASAHPSIDAQYTYAGEAESPDGKADVIDARNADGFAARLFIDRESRLPLMVTYQGPQPRMITVGGPPPGGRNQQTREPSEEERRTAREAAEKQLAQPAAMVEFTVFFEDWRDVNGVKFPHRMRRATAGTTNEEWTVTKVKVNPKLDPKKFEG